MTVGALGVVFGDIGTSPLYAMQEMLRSPDHNLRVDETNIFGLLSLITWSLIIVITIKYLIFVMRADNDGEGGILALTSLLPVRHGRGPGGARGAAILILLGLFGTALLYGDGIITPAISVLSAVEGTELISPGMQPWVVPLAVLIIIGLFAAQPRGTERIGKVFGPIMVVWFSTLAVLGIVHVARSPGVLGALNPIWAVRFFQLDSFKGFLTLGAVCLVVTGGEALYADMGHFGRSPIRRGWYLFVLPALLANYFGQGALMLNDPTTVNNPFYLMAPSWALYPLVVLATAATVIASQALISGAFSLTMQAAQLGYTPRVRVTHTSESESGQIYVPAVNWALMTACIAIILTFRSSENLAAAYGLAVTGTMSITTIIFFVVARHKLHMNGFLVGSACAVFLVVELSFLAANLFKIPSGGWLPLVVAAIIFTLLTTWFTGRKLVSQFTKTERPSLDEFIQRIENDPPVRVPGTAVYLFSTPGFTPPSLVRNLRHTEALHEQIIVLSVQTEDVPNVGEDERCEITNLEDGFIQVVAHYGFLEHPDIPDLLLGRAFRGRELNLQTVTYFVAREALRVSDRKGMARWRERLFAIMARNAASAATYFGLPDDQTIEIGIHVAI